MRRRRPPPTYACPNCEAEVRVGALACPSCGSDAETGWSEDADDIWYEDLPGYDDEPEDASPGARGLHPAVVLALVVVAVVVLVLM